MQTKLNFKKTEKNEKISENIVNSNLKKRTYEDL